MDFVLFGEWNPPEYVIHTRGKVFQPSKRKAVLKCAKGHLCEVNTVGILACKFSKFLRFIQGIFSETSLQKLNGVTDLSHENF